MNKSQTTTDWKVKCQGCGKETVILYRSTSLICGCGHGGAMQYVDQPNVSDKIQTIDREPLLRNPTMINLSDIPTYPHFAIIRTTSVTTPGDERSRTNPGHGYPESTEMFITYQVFTDYAKWEAEIAKLSAQRYADPFRALSVTPAKISISVSVSID